MKKILYIANIRLPTEKAHGVQIMKTCEAFALAGAAVTLVVPRRFTPIKDNVFQYYGIRKQFTIVRLPTIDLVRFGRAGFVVQSLTFSAGAFFYCLLRAGDAIFSRDEMPLWFASFTFKKILWESHTGAWNFFARHVARRCFKLIAISGGIKKLYTARGIDAQKIIVAPDGVDLNDFINPEPVAAARQRLGLPQDKKIALYIGRLDGWKGIDTLLGALPFLPGDISVAIIGGEPAQVKRLKALHPKVHFLGYHPYAEVAGNQAAADVLVLPNTAKDGVSADLTSPLKLFTYMASGKPIVASDLPSIREVLSDESCYLAKPDSPEDFAKRIVEACADNNEAKRKAEVALELVKGYSWQARAKKIITAI
jgi:glycosyltransferase involved in cell wall biosynthesis